MWCALTSPLTLPPTRPVTSPPGRRQTVIGETLTWVVPSTLGQVQRAAHTIIEAVQARAQRKEGMQALVDQARAIKAGPLPHAGGGPRVPHTQSPAHKHCRRLTAVYVNSRLFTPRATTPVRLTDAR